MNQKKQKITKLLKTKYLTPICLLIFLMPFLRMCTSAKFVETQENKNRNNTEVVTSDSYTGGDDVNLNAYQLGFGVFKEGFDAKMFKDKEFYSVASYSFIILFSVLMIIFSWLKKYLWIRNLAIINMMLLIISTLLLVKSGFIDEFGDVKYGVYVFLLYSLFIIFTAQKEQNNSELNEP